DETQAQLGGDNGMNSPLFGTDPIHPNVDRGRSDFDIRHNLRFNTIYDLPGPASNRILGLLLKGWSVSGILSLQTGYPFTINITNNRSLSGVQVGQQTSIDRPDLVAGRNNGNIVSGVTGGCLGVAPGQKLGTPNRYFDPCAFAIPAAGFLGTA